MSGKSGLARSLPFNQIWALEGKRLKIAADRRSSSRPQSRSPLLRERESEKHRLETHQLQTAISFPFRMNRSIVGKRTETVLQQMVAIFSFKRSKCERQPGIFTSKIFLFPCAFGLQS
jgi:hypothetical protein